MKIEIPENFHENIEKFTQILKEFNKVHSLTNYEDINSIVQDSIKPLEFLSDYPKIAIDIGSGAGFPAIFLAMILRKTSWYLFEPNAKKSAFLTYIKINLKLENIYIYRKKIQDAQKFKADLITSRALMKTYNLIKICNGFYDEKTKFLLYKGSSYQSEIKNLNTQIFNAGVRNYILISEVK